MKGKTGVDATTLEANAAMRSIERRDTGDARHLALLGAFRPFAEGQTSNEEWTGPGREDREDEGRSLKQDIAVVRFALFTFAPIILALLVKLVFFP